MRYRSYQKVDQGRPIGLPDIINCNSDEAAIGWAEHSSKLLGFGTVFEVWQGSRLVARLPRRVDENK